MINRTYELRRELRGPGLRTREPRQDAGNWAEAALEESESRFLLLMDTVPVAVGRCDANGRFSFANRRFADCYGLLPGEIIGKAMDELLGPRQWGEIRPCVERVREGRAAEVEHDLDVPGLGWRTLHCKLAPEIDLSGKVAGWLILATDVTARNQAEMKIRHNTVRWQILSESLAHLLSVKDSEGIVAGLFPKVAAHIGAEAFTNFLLPEGSSELVLHCHEGLSPEMAKALERLPIGASLCGLVAQRRAPLMANDLQNSVDPRSAPLRMRGFRSYTGVPLFVGDHLVGTLGFASRTKDCFSCDELEFISLIAGYAAVVIDRVRSERVLKDREERLRSLFENHLDAIFSIDRLGRIVSHNRAMESLSGYPPAELERMDFADLCVPESSAAARAAFARSTQGQPGELEIAILRKGGGRVELFVSAIPITVGEETVGAFVIARDITERKQSQSALMALNGELEERVQQRTRVLKAAMQELRHENSERRRLEDEILKISEREQARIGQDLHDDLGQQLAGIAMLAHLISNQLQAEGHPKATEAAQLTKYLRQSIAAARDLAKSLFPVELERGGLMLALQDLAERTTQLTKVHCELRFVAPFVCEKASAIHLYRIVQESVGNALKHGKARRIIIEYKCGPEGPMLTVTDDGVGFVSTETRTDGMGLQLFQYRARLIGAKIEVRSGIDSGCQVTCLLKAPLH